MRIKIVDEGYEDISSLNENELMVLNSIFIAIFLISLIANSMVLSVFIRHKRLRKPINFFTVVLTCVNLFSTLVYMPIIIVGTYLKKILFGQIGCDLQGFIMFFCGCFSIFLLTILSVERYWLIFRPFQISFISYKICLLILLASGLLCLLWGSFPIIGWSYYSFESGKLYCSIEWNDRSWNVRSFNIVTMIIFFVFPLTTILFTNVRILVILKSKTCRRENIEAMMTDYALNKQRVNQTKIVVLLSSMYILSWTPYACVSMYSAFISKNPVNFYTAILPGICAKSTIVWCPLLEMKFNKRVRQNLFKSCMQNNVNDEASSFIPTVPRNSRASHIITYAK